MNGVTLANLEDVVHFEKGMTLVIPFGETTRRVGKAVVTEINRTTGTFTISHFADALKELYPADAVRAIAYDGQQLLGALPRVTPLECGIAAAVALGGLGWVIARRNALAGTEETSESWVRAVAEWLVALVRGLFGNGTKQIPSASAHGAGGDLRTTIANERGAETGSAAGAVVDGG